MKKIFQVGLLLMCIINAFSFSIGFESCIVSRISPWASIYFVLYSISIMVVCWSPHKNEKEEKYLYMLLFLIGLANGLLTLAVHIIMIQIFGFITALVFLAAIIAVISTVNYANHKRTLSQLFFSILAMAMSLVLIKETATVINQPLALWFCYLVLIAVEVLILFFFEIIRHLKLTARGDAVTREV